MRASVVPWFRRLKTALWLAAWCAWVWLGFGLYRELPRDMPRESAPSVGRLRLEDGETKVGRTPDERFAVTTAEPSDDADRTGAVRVRDFDGGAPIHEWSVSIAEASGLNYSATHGVAFFRRPDPEAKVKPAGVPCILDVVAGAVVELASSQPFERYVDTVTFHAERPWIVFLEATRSVTGKTVANRVVVVNFRTRERLLEVPLGDNDERKRRFFTPSHFFLGDRLVALPANVAASDTELHVWKIPSPGRPEAVYTGFGPITKVARSRTGRVALQMSNAEPPQFDVFDLDAGKFVFSHPPRENRTGRFGNGEWRPVAISSDGRTVLQTETNTVWDVDAGKPLLTYGKNDRVLYFDGDRIVIAEDADSNPFMHLLVRSPHVVKDLRSGATIFRYGGSAAESSFDVSSYFDDDNPVRPQPPRVNFTMLAVAQSILALPLLSVWAIGRWRRRKRALPKSASAV